MTDDTIAVNVKHLKKTFKIPLEASNGIKQKIINLTKGRKGYRDFSPLDDISFTINKGDFFGIVGRNGSGKSTLLKTIAGIYKPNQGSVDVKGRLVPFIELGVGFNPELTGRENVYLNGALLGFSNNEIDEMYDDIVGFAELHDFMEERLKNFSSGMQVRLAFSIAIRANGDILLLDEILAVGDAKFQQKCYDYFYRLKDEKKTVIFISHDMDAMQKFCNKIIYLKDGKLVAQGKPDEVADKYLSDLYGESVQESRDGDVVLSNEKILPHFACNIKNKKKIYKHGDKVEIEFQYELIKVADIELRFAVLNNGIAIAHRNSRDIKFEDTVGKKSVSFFIDTNNFIGGDYSIDAAIVNRKTGERYAGINKTDSFFIEKQPDIYYGYFKVEGEWRD